MGLALGTNLKLYTSVVKGLKLKVRKFWELTPTFVEVTGVFLPPPPNRVKTLINIGGHYKTKRCFVGRSVKLRIGCFVMENADH